MERGLYIAASGMLAEQVRQDQIANDLANASTPGYKPDRAAQSVFGALLLQNRQTGAQVGPLYLGARIAELRTDLTQGPLQQTDNPLDVAIHGDGFFSVQTPDGTRYTRNGQSRAGCAGPPGDHRGRAAPGHRRQADHGRPGRRHVHRAGRHCALGHEGGRPDRRRVPHQRRQAGRQRLHRHPGRQARGDDGGAGLPGGLGRRAGQGDGGHDRVAARLRGVQRVLHAIDDTLGRAVNSVGSSTG